jgi:hypothetical protein
MTLEDKLQQLREQWKTASISDRKVLEIRAKLLKMGNPNLLEDVKRYIIKGT